MGITMRAVVSCLLFAVVAGCGQHNDASPHTNVAAGRKVRECSDPSRAEVFYGVVSRMQDSYTDKRLPHAEQLRDGDYPLLGEDGRLKPFDQIARDHRLDSAENALVNWLDNYGNGGLAVEMSIKEFDAQCGTP